jgi:hypothetical protein
MDMADLFSRFNQVTKPVKVIDRNTHAVLDYLTASYFLLAGGLLWNRTRRAGIAAAINGFFVLGMSLFTDYSGSARGLISFRTHGKLDVLQAAMAASMPTVMGFADSASSVLFRGQALNEALVITLTDWEQRGTVPRRIRRAA